MFTVNSGLSFALAARPAAPAVDTKIGVADPRARRTVVVIVIADNAGVVISDFWDGAAFWLDRWWTAKVVGSRPEATLVLFTLASSFAGFGWIGAVLKEMKRQKN